MVIHNKTTFDPYSVGEFRVRDALRIARLFWWKHRWAYTGLAVLASVPSLFGFFWAPDWATFTACGLTLLFLTSLISPMVARQARGLNADFVNSLRAILSRILVLLVVGALMGAAVAGPALVCHYTIGPIFAYPALVLGIFLATPFILTIPIVLIESLSLFASFKRSLFMMQGRYMRALPLLAAGVFTAVLPVAIKSHAPVAAIVALCLQPVLLTWCAIGVGALYTNLYDH